RLPLQPAFGAFEGAVDVVVAGVAATGVGLGPGHLVVDVGVLMTKAATAGGAGATGVIVAEPAFHGWPLRGSNVVPARRGRTCKSCSWRSGLSELDEKAQVEPVGPEVGTVEHRRRAGGADQGLVEGLGRVDAAVELVAGAEDVGPVEELVADLEADRVVQVHADVDAELGHDAELRVLLAAGVGRLGEDAAGVDA